MQLVDSCALFPGEAIGGGGSQNVVDTGIEVQAHGRVYLGHQHAIDAGIAAGCVHPQAFDAVVEQLTASEKMVERLQAQLADALEQVAAAEELRIAVARTLQEGVVIAGKGKQLSIELRHRPGQKRIDIGACLLPEFALAVAGTD